MDLAVVSAQQTGKKTSEKSESESDSDSDDDEGSENLERTKFTSEVTSSAQFTIEQVKQAGINPEIHTETDSRITLNQFPWLIFDTNVIPVTQKHERHLPRDRIKVIQEGSTHIMQEGQWTIEHEINTSWIDYFESVYQAYRKRRPPTNEPRDSSLEQRAENLCECFGFASVASYKLDAHPDFSLTANESRHDLCVKPDGAGSYWRIENKIISCCLTEKSIQPTLVKTTKLLQSLQLVKSQTNWMPKIGHLLLPNVIIECKSQHSATKQNYTDMNKMFIEMAILHDTEKRLYTACRQDTLGIYFFADECLFFALKDAPTKGQYKYEVFHLHTTKLGNNFIDWMSLGTVMYRLSAYNLSRFLKLSINVDLPTFINQLHQLTLVKREKKAQAKKIAEGKKLETDMACDGEAGDDEDLKKFKDENNKSSKKRKIADISSTVKEQQSSSINNNINDRNQSKKAKIHAWSVTAKKLLHSTPASDIYLALLNDGAEIAIKVIKYADGEHEVQALKHAAGPGIVKMFHSERNSDGFVTILMEKLLPLPKKFLNQEELQQFARGLIGALYWLHYNNMVHGDIKCDNIMMSSTKEVKLIDFGFAVKLPKGQNLKYDYGGTPLYWSPERLNKKNQDEKIDIYSAGLVIAEMMYGNVMDSVKSREQLIKKVQSGTIEHLATLAGIALVNAMLEEDSHKRLSAESCLALQMVPKMDESLQRNE